MARTQKTTTTPTKQYVGTPEYNRTAGPTREQIERRAYELFLSRGCTNGHDQEDWLQAERELSLGRYTN